MTQKEELEQIKSAINKLLVQTTILCTENAVLKSLVLDGIIDNTMPEISRNIYTDFVNRFESMMIENLDKMDEHLLCATDYDFLLRQKFNLSSMISTMKADGRYLQTED